MNSRLARLLVLAWLATGLLPHPASAGVLALFDTPVGRLEVELFPEDKPLTVDNFIRYVKSGSYRDSIIHRLPVDGLTLRANFVAQGGGLWVTNRGTASSTFAFVPTFAPIPNEFATGRQLSNTYGTIAMAKVGSNTNSATSQWFFNLGDNSFLDANQPDRLFVVFGRVVGGTNTLESFKSFHWYTGVETSNVVTSVGTNPFPLGELPLLLPLLTERTLVFVDIQLLSLAIQPLPDGARELSWTSVSNRLQHLETRGGNDAAWRTLTTINGTGETVRFTDTEPDTARLYRVRVDY